MLHETRRSDEPALLAPGRAPLTHGALAAQVDALAAAVAALGVGHHERVAAVMGEGPAAATTFLGTMAVAVAAPLNPGFTETELAFYLDDLSARLLVVDAGLDTPARAVAEARGIPVLEVTPSADVAGALAFDAPAGPVPAAAGPDDVALVLHTSGTTSRPKLVPLTHANLAASATAIGTTLGLGPNDRCLNVMPLFHIHGLVAAVLASLNAGGSTVCAGPFRADAFLGWLEAFRPTWYTAVPTIHAAAVGALGGGPVASSLRFVRSSSAALPPTLMAELERTFGVPVVEAYGMTEAAHQMASNPLPPAVRKPGTVGLAAGPEVAVLGPDGVGIEAGVKGEIVIRGASVTTGYGDPEATREAFLDGWFRTGDEGVLDEDGYLTITGRLKELINRGGEKVAPREVDEVLLAHPDVATAVAFGVPHPTLGEEVAAAVVLRPGATADEAELRAFAAARLAPGKRPRRVVLVDDVPKGPTGKLQRIGLAVRLGLVTDAATPGEASRTASPVEAALVGLWADLLGLERVGLDDDFILLGGDSLLAARLVGRVAEALAVDVPVPAVFDEAATVAGMAALVERLRTAPAAEPAVSAGQAGSWFLARLDGESTPSILAARLLWRLEQRFGRRLPLAMFFQEPTVRRLADAAREERVESSATTVLPIQPQGRLAPLFCVQGGRGGYVSMRSMAAGLGPDRPVFGLWSMDLLQGRVRVEALAAGSVAALRRAAPTGPYHLFGHSLGGLVAWELAQQLVADGDEVALLVVADTVCPAARPSAWAKARRVGTRRVASAVWRRFVPPPPEDGTPIDVRRALRVSATYRPPPAVSPVLLVRAADTTAEIGDPLLGWGPLLDERSEVVEVAADHLSLLQGPAVHELGRRIAEALQP